MYPPHFPSSCPTATTESLIPSLPQTLPTDARTTLPTFPSRPRHSAHRKCDPPPYTCTSQHPQPDFSRMQARMRMYAISVHDDSDAPSATAAAAARGQPSL
eukprot:365340-Chlamydomonas_euryale.AAC.11